MIDYRENSLSSHRCFRTLLQAMSHPGTIYQQPRPTDTDEHENLLRLLNTVIDQQASSYLIDAEASFSERLVEITGTCLGDVADADFIIALRGESRGQLLQAKRGLPGYPDQGATVVYVVDQLATNAEGQRARLTGPGIKDHQDITVAGLGGQELALLREVNVEFPLGVDVIFLDRQQQLMCIPRSTQIGVV